MSTLTGRRLTPHLFIGLTLPLLAGAGEGDNWQRLRAMPREQRVVLDQKIREFDRLSRSQQAALRTLDEKIAALPPAEQSNYRAVLRRYHLWFQTLSEDQQNQLAQAATTKEKLALMAKLRRAHGPESDHSPTHLLFQLADLQGRSPFEVAQLLRVWTTLSAKEQGEIEKLGGRDRLQRLAELARQAKLEPIPPLAPKDEAATAELLEKDLQTKGWLRHQLKKDTEKQTIDRRRLVNNYYFVVNPPKPVSSSNLLRFESTMPSWIRNSFDHLAPEEARRRLTILYRLIYPGDKEITNAGPGATAPAPPSAPAPKAPVAPPQPAVAPPI